jgi:HlyD family secretion protein
LTSPELEQSAHDAELQAKGAEAELTTMRATLQRELLDQESKTTAAHSAYEQSKMERQTNDQLAKNGLVADLVYKTSKIKEEECQKSDEIEQKRLAFARDSIEPQLTSKQAAVDQANQLAKLKLDQVEALHVKAGMSGVLQQLPVQIGQRLKVGDNLARVADPTKLKAQVKIAETQAKDIQIKQKAVIDTRNGTVNGHVPQSSRERLMSKLRSMSRCRKARAPILVSTEQLSSNISTTSSTWGGRHSDRKTTPSACLSSSTATGKLCAHRLNLARAR